MSYSFKQFLSSLGANSGGTADVSQSHDTVHASDDTVLENDGKVNEQQEMSTRALDATGGFSPVLLYDPVTGTNPSLFPSLSQTPNSCGDSPGINSHNTSSSSTPLVFSKAEEFISATLSNVKIATGAGTGPLPTQTISDEHSDENKSINYNTNSDSIKVDEANALTAHNDLIETNQTTSNNSNINIESELLNKNTDVENKTIITSVKQECGEDDNVKKVQEAIVECDDVDSKSALKTPYVDGVASNKSNSSSDSSNKIWREGMDKQSGESSKTMFISQNLTKMYDKADAETKGVTYNTCTSKIIREITYFEKILNVIGTDMRDTEYTMKSDDVLLTRKRIKEKVEAVKVALDKFSVESLEGEVREKPPAKREPAAKIQVEYVHPPEKKTPKEAKAELCLENVDIANSLHKCVDCGQYITIGEGESLEGALEKHSNSADHRNSVKNGESSGERSNAVQKQQQKDKTENNKKALEKVPRQNVLNHTQSRQMMLNQITSQTVNGQVILTCNPCGDTITVEAFTNHVNTNTHKDNLNNFNIRLQKDLIVKYPDLFGSGKMFHLTDLHTVMNKIFVDPLAKYSYCGLCRKELPSKQMNIDEHITSKGHEKLLLASMEGKVSKVQQKEVGATTVVNNDAASEYCDNVNIAKQRTQQDRRSSGNIQPYYEIEEKDKFYGATSLDGKFVCLLCDARGITSLQNLISHFHGGPHKTNLEHAKQLRGGLDPDTQLLFIKNMISVTYGRFPLIFECFACHSPPFAGAQGATDHISSQGHVTMLAYKQQQQKAQHSKVDRNETRRSNVVTNVILHRNGINYWCLSCRCELVDISSAYRHVLLPGHLTASVDGVSMLQGTQFYCDHCGVLINGEKNVGQHITSQKHRQQVVPAGKTNVSRESKTPPSYSRAQVKKMEDERNGNKSSPQSADDGKLKTEERMLLHKNFVNISKKNLFQCKVCDSEQMTRSKILTHIFSYQHMLKMQNQLLPIVN